MNARVRTPGTSFCLITDGRRPEGLVREIASIRALALPAYEIIVAGDVPPQLTEVETDVITVTAPNLARGGHLGAMRNLACARAQFDQLVVADDDMIFHDDFANALAALGDTADVVCVRLLNPDGTRYWDWATHGGPRGHTLLEYDQQDDFVYVTGGLAIMKASVHDRVQWDDVRGFYAGEDLDWSGRVRSAGFRIRHSAAATVTHNDPRYTQRRNGIIFRQDLTLSDRIIVGVDGIGFYRPLEAGFRWMAESGALIVAASATHARTLHFSLASVAESLASAPLTVRVQVNGANAGAFTFNGPQSFSAAIPVSANASVRVQLLSDRTAPAREVGLDDERTVSVMLHEVALNTATPS